MLILCATANHVVLHCSIYACVMSQMFLFYFIFYGGALVFLGGAGALASPSLLAPMFVYMVYFVVCTLTPQYKVLNSDLFTKRGTD